MAICKMLDPSDLSTPEHRAIIRQMHDMMGLKNHPIRIRAKCGHGRQRRAEIESGKHWEYPWCVLNGDFSPGQKVLDCGAGRGILQYYLARKGCNVSTCNISSSRSRKFLKFQYALHRIGLAPAPDLTARFRKNARYFGVNVECRIESILDLSWQDAYFDRVLCLSVLEHITPPSAQKKAVEQMVRVLKPGGLLILTVDFTVPPTAGKEDVFYPETVMKLIEWSQCAPVDVPLFEVPHWDAYLQSLARAFGSDSFGYSAYGLVLRKGL